jgi:glutamate racemase
MMARGVDRVVMGCTHYPFVIPLIREIVGPGVEVIDPAPAVARQVGRLLETHALNAPQSASGTVQFLTTGDPAKLESLLPRLIGQDAQVGTLRWEQGQLR